MIIQSNVESGPKMIQFNIQFKMNSEIFIQSKNSFKSKSKIFNSIFNSRIWWKMIQNAQWSRICFICPKLELWLALCMSFVHIVCPFSHFHQFFILCWTFFKLDVLFFNILFIFPMNDTFFSFIQQFIQFFVAKYSLKKY